MDPSLTGEGDPHDDALVDEIVTSLSSLGKYVTRVDARPTQGLVDLHWAAHRAGRRLGIKVRVLVEGAPRATRRDPISDSSPSVTVTVIPRRHDQWRVAQEAR